MITASRNRSFGMVEDHLKYRFDYPEKLIDFLYDACGFSRESVIADIGSGMGTFTRLLLERGSRVVAIEPCRELRETAERILADEFPRFFSLEACAENTTLSDASVHHIACAQSFHYFDGEKCRREFRRILRPEGSVVLIGMRPVCDDEFNRECDALIRRYSGYGRGMGGEDMDSVYSAFFSGSGFVNFSLSGQMSLDFEGLRGRLFSSYCLPGPGENGHDELMEELELLFELYQQSGKVNYIYEIRAYAGKPDDAI